MRVSMINDKTYGEIETKTLILILLINVQQFHVLKTHNFSFQLSPAARKHEISSQDKEHKRSVIETEVEKFLIFYVLRHHEATPGIFRKIFISTLAGLQGISRKFLFSLRQKINEPHFFLLHFVKNVFESSLYQACFWEHA